MEKQGSCVERDEVEEREASEGAVGSVVGRDELEERDI